jgi:ATP-dependent RNA helicase RhlE
MKFTQLRLSEPILWAVEAAGYEAATPIQAQAIPPVLEGRDLLGCAQTGTGKTAAFALPILERLSRHRGEGRRPIRALVVTPTRELAAQIATSFRVYGQRLWLRGAVAFGGVSQVHQVEELRRGVDILVATPGRLLDLISQGHVRLDRVELFVLDEADRMLDMGFLPDVRRIIDRLPARRQTLLFSATMPAEIRRLAAGILVDPIEVAVTPPATAAQTVDQRVYLVAREDKQALLAHLLRGGTITKALVFTRTKHGADRVAKNLGRASIGATAIHGGKSQNQRLRALDAFKRGDIRVLVASDLASRGLDIDEVSHVVNFDLPNEPEVYVHRIGRTGRAGAHGTALSFCAFEERGFLAAIERLTRTAVTVSEDHPFAPAFAKLGPGSTEVPRDKRPAGASDRSAAPRNGRSRGRGGRPMTRPGSVRGGRRPPDLSRRTAPDVPRASTPASSPRREAGPAAPRPEQPRPLPLARPRTRSWRPGR